MSVGPGLSKEVLNNLTPFLEIRNKTNNNFSTLFDWTETTRSAYSVNTKHVSKNVGNDTTGDGKVNNPYATISKAISVIIDNDSTHRYIIRVAPSIYQENNSVSPLSLGEYITLEGKGDVRITPTDTSKVLLSVDPFATVTNITLEGVTTGAAISITGAGPLLLNSITLIDCQTGILVNNASAKVIVNTATVATFGGSFTTLYEVLSGQLTVRDTTILSGSTIVTVVKTNGFGSVSVLNGMSATGLTSINGFYANNGGIIAFSDIALGGMTNALRVDNNSVISGSGVHITSNVLDVLQEDINSTVSIVSGSIDYNKLSATNWENIYLNAMSLVEGDESLILTTELAVGTPELGRETVLGEGDSTSRGSKVYSFDPITDRTVVSSSPSGSTFTFPIAANNGFYIGWNLYNGGDYKKFYGIKINIPTAMVLGSGSVVWEFWNGSSWEAFDVMVTDSSGYYTSHGNSLDGLTGAYQIRFNIKIKQIWTKNDPVSLGGDRYWVRFRVATDITTAPNIEHIKLHTSRSEMNADGWMEYFGEARPIRNFPWDYGMSNPSTESSQTPTDNPLYISDSLYIDRTVNGFRDAKIDLTALNGQIPFDMDTSTPINFRWFFKGDVAGGNVRWQITWGWTEDGDSIFDNDTEAPTTGPNEQVIELTSTIANDDAQYSEYVSLAIPEAVAFKADTSSALLWVSIRRLGTDILDTYTGTIAILNIIPRYLGWNNGTHIVF